MAEKSGKTPSAFRTEQAMTNNRPRWEYWNADLPGYKTGVKRGKPTIGQISASLPMDGSTRASVAVLDSPAKENPDGRCTGRSLFAKSRERLLQPSDPQRAFKEI
jgi:hypothetical protein